MPRPANKPWPPFTAKQQKDRKELGIVDFRARLNPQRKSSLLEIPTEILVGIGRVAGIVPPGAVVWASGASFVRFGVPQDPKFEGYVLCSYLHRVISKIGPSSYGWRNLKSTSVDFGWTLKRRSGLRIGRSRRTSLKVEVFVTFVSKDKLQDARAAGLTSPKLAP